MTNTDEVTKKEAKDKVSDKAPLRIDTALSPSEGKRHPGRLELSSTKNHFIPAPLPSAVATARITEDIGSIQYPEGVKSPRPELNVNACRQAGQVPVRRCVFILFVCEQI